MSVKAVSRCICYFCGFIVIYSLYLFFPNGAEIIIIITCDYIGLDTLCEHNNYGNNNYIGIEKVIIIIM